MRTLYKATALIAGAVMLASACGDDSDDDNDSESSSDESQDEAAAAYCDVARELDQSEAQPTEEQLESLREEAPEEIAEDVNYVVDAVLERGPQAFFEDDVAERYEPIGEFEERVCGIEADPDEEEALPEGVTTEVDPDAQQVAVSATDYEFTFDAPEAGAASFVMTNDGEEAHHMGIVRLEEGVTLEDAMAMPEDEVDDVIALEAFTDPVGPGEEAVLTFEDLEAGEYQMLCFVPTEDGTPHAELGMAQTFTVS